MFISNLLRIQNSVYSTELSSYLRKACHTAVKLLGNACTIVAGHDDFHLQFVAEANDSIQILKHSRVDYGGKLGCEAAIYSSSDLLGNVKFLEEHRLIQDPFEGIGSTTGKYAIDLQPTLKALQMGLDDTLLVWDNFEDDGNMLKKSLEDKCGILIKRVIDKLRNGRQFCIQFSGIGAIMETKMDIDDDDDEDPECELL